MVFERDSLSWQFTDNKTEVVESRNRLRPKETRHWKRYKRQRETTILYFTRNHGSSANKEKKYAESRNRLRPEGTWLWKNASKFIQGFQFFSKSILFLSWYKIHRITAQNLQFLQSSNHKKRSIDKKYFYKPEYMIVQTRKFQTIRWWVRQIFDFKIVGDVIVKD